MQFQRDVYLERLKVRMNNGMVKIITGIRRCGKSYLLNNIFYNYLLSQGIDKSHVIRFAFDSDEDIETLGTEESVFTSDRKINSKVFRAYVSSLLKEETTYYLLLDEVQLLDNFEAVLNGFLRHDNLDIYVTGSNSKFLSSDIITEFRGRGDEIHVLPLVFSELLTGFEGYSEALWQDYIFYGGLPPVALMRTDEQKSSYLKNVAKNVYLSDIISRNKVRRDEELGELLDILASGIGSLTNPTKLSNTFGSVKGKALSVDTISDYIKYFEDSFVLSKAKRYDIKGKKYINSPYKLYFEDVGLRNARLNFRQVEETHILENVIYNELRYREYNVDVGVVEVRERQKTNDDVKMLKKQYEVDFVATQGNKKYYIQCALHMDTADKFEQETKSLRNIDDYFKKIVVVKDDIKLRRDESGIVIMSIKDFLLDKYSLEK